MKIGFWELVVVVIVAFVFIGPDQLPVYAKKIGKMLRELKKYTGAASEEIQKNVVEPLNEIQAPLKEAVAPLTDIKKDIDNSVKDVTKSFTGIGKTSKEEAAKAEAAEEVTELTEEPVEELEEDAAPAAKAEESAPAEETAAPAEKAEEAEEDKADEEEEETPMKEIVRTRLDSMRIIDEGAVHMARLAVYASSYTNGVAEIHTQILKDDVLKDWYAVYPERFQNKTNGITPRRWLGLSNPELCGLLDSKVGAGYLKHLDQLEGLKAGIDEMTVKQFNAIKLEKKRQLCRVIEEHEGVALDPSFIFDVQVKRLHEYKRQLMNALSIMDLYLSIKDGSIKDFTPTAFIFGAKAAPGYRRAKAIIHYVNRVADLINSDPAMDGVMKVVFVQNYNCSYAEHIADISEQISPAGTEASGTGNMKLMLNGAVTLGTLDGANVEIAEQAGSENEYIFGATVEEINMVKPNYNARSFYEANPNLRRAVDTLIDGTVPTDEEQHELYTSLLEGASWHKPDQYFLFYDFDSYKKARLRVNHDYCDRIAFGRKCLMNVASAGKFSSDRTIRQYAEDIWHIQPVK